MRKEPNQAHAHCEPLGVCLVLLAFTRLSFGQSSGSEITGGVRDPSGAALPKVVVAPTSPARSEKSRRGGTRRAGEYRIDDLRPGLYTVTITEERFPCSRHGCV